MRFCGMRTDISFTVSRTERQRLGAIAADPKSPQKHVWRARIVLLSGDGLGTSAIMAATAKSKTCVWRWQERFMHEGIDGLLRDRSRPPGKTPVAPGRVAQIVRLTQEPPPHEATHWTLRAMATSKHSGGFSMNARHTTTPWQILQNALHVLKRRFWKRLPLRMSHLLNRKQPLPSRQELMLDADNLTTSEMPVIS